MRHRAGRAAGTLARLCAAAGVTSAESLPQSEEAAWRKREAARSLAQARRQLAQASSRSEEDLRQCAWRVVTP